MTRPYRKTQKFFDRHGEQCRSAEERAKTMAALYRDGYTLRQIGDQYGITHERVRQLMTQILGVTGKDGGASVIAARKAAIRLAQREARCLRLHGCSVAEWKAIGRRACDQYRAQRRNASARGIAWELTLWQWWKIWQQSGKWSKRGRGQGYGMCRTGDTGPYAVGNVFIATAIENASKRNNRKFDLPIGVSLRLGRYYVAHRMIDGKSRYLGQFSSPELAHAAYLAAAPRSQSEAA